VVSTGPGTEPASGVAVKSPAGRWIVLAAVLGSGMALLDGTVVNVAVKAIGEDLDAELTELQWVVNAYMLSLAALILIGGSLGDRFGRRRMLMVGIAWFAAASLLCGLAQDPLQLVAARGLQGVGGALLTPGSLAILQATLQRSDRSRGIGTWSAYTGIAAAVGPLLGGWLIQVLSWRWVFFINVPLAVVVLLVTARHVPESGHRVPGARFDLGGAALGAVGLGAITYALIEANHGAGTGVITATALGLLALVAFVQLERHLHDPMLPPRLFTDRTFSVVNLVTFAVYGALGGMLFLLVLQLQVSSGFSPLAAGVSILPFTVIMLLFSSRAGALATRIGPRTQLVAGPLVAAAGVVVLSRVAAGATYLGDVLPGICLFGSGMTLLVAPLTATVLAAAPDEDAGIASGVNNAVARAGSLLFVAALPTVVGLSDTDYQDPVALTEGYRAALMICTAFLVLGAAIALTVPRHQAV
jgi:EmrB/QacA subfamily drug resistance transporter